MRTTINALMLVGVLGLPSLIVFVIVRAGRRRGLDDHYEQPEGFDYEKW
jgi:hypothetical protein